MTSASMARAYVRAEALLPQHAAVLARDVDIGARWLRGADDVLAFKRATARGWRFLVFQAGAARVRPAFDHAAMAAALERALGNPVSPDRLPISSLDRDDDALIVTTTSGRRYRVPRGARTADALPIDDPGLTVSPCGRCAISARGGNLWLHERASGTERALTSDGGPQLRYGAVADQAGALTRSRAGTVVPPIGSWSPDGSTFLTYRLDERDVPELALLQHVTDAIPPRPVVHRFCMALPGDRPPSATLVLVDTTGTRAPPSVDHPPIAPLFAFPPPFDGTARWSTDSATVHFVVYRNAYRETALVRLDVSSGRCESLIVDRATTNQSSFDRPSFALLASGEVVWPSERDDRQRLHLHDAHGRWIRALSEADTVVRELLFVDERARIAFYSAGIDDGVADPYLRHVFSVRLDDARVERLTEEATDHQAMKMVRATPVQPPERVSMFSPSGACFVDAHSTATQPTRTIVRDRRGVPLATLAIAACSAAGRRRFALPEPFDVLAADGVTRLWGNLYRPRRFDPRKRYPVIDAMYGGPQAVFVPKRFMESVAGLYGHFLAELGCIVVNVDGRGTPHRARAFGDASYGALGDAGGLVDHVAALSALARTRPWMDLSRVGAYGYSGGGYAVVHALLDHPDTYRAGVAVSPYDPMLTESSWWERFMGPFDAERHRAQASYANATRLKGSLLLATGDLDDIAHPAGMLAVVDALVRADKDFEMLVVPDADHALVITPYMIRRTFDHFVRHLLQREPPDADALANARATADHAGERA